MKFFIAILAFVAFVAAEIEWMPKTKGETKAIHIRCLTGNSIPDLHMENNLEPISKYLLVLCALIKTGVFSEHEELGSQFGENDSIKGIVEKCADKNEEKSSAYKWAYRNAMCIISSQLEEKIRTYFKSVTNTA